MFYGVEDRSSVIMIFGLGTFLVRVSQARGDLTHGRTAQHDPFLSGTGWP
jgi:hypothetical protein